MTTLQSSPHTTVAVDWKPKGVRRLIAFTAAHFVGLMEDGRTVLKYPIQKTQESMDNIRDEAKRYVHLGYHDNLVAFRAIHQDGLLLEFCELGELSDILDILNRSQKMRIGEQITRGLIHLHSKNYVHCDLRLRNIFVTSGTIAKIGDMQGQLNRPDGSIAIEAVGVESPKARHPDIDDEYTPVTDIFALGTLLYHLWYGHLPFPELDERIHEEEIQAKYRRGEFPIDVANATGIDKIIVQCWTTRYKIAEEILGDMLCLVN